MGNRDWKRHDRKRKQENKIKELMTARYTNNRDSIRGRDDLRSTRERAK